MKSKTLADLEPGDWVGVRQVGRSERDFVRIESVTRVTRTQVITIQGRRYHKHNGRYANQRTTGVIYPITRREVDQWINRMRKAEQRRDDNLRKINASQSAQAYVEESGTVMAATLRNLRDRARTLCEKLQNVAAIEWNAEFVKLVEEIEATEKVLPSIGLSTTLLPSKELLV